MNLDFFAVLVGVFLIMIGVVNGLDLLIELLERGFVVFQRWLGGGDS